MLFHPPQKPQQQQALTETEYSDSVSHPTSSNRGGAPNDVFHRLDASTLSNKLIESVTMVKDLMQTNREMMGTAEGLTQQIETKDTENFHLSIENRDLRDRIEILESVIATSNF
jgi:hypothetical protein